MKTEIVQLKTSWGGVIQEALAFGTYISIFLFKQKTAYEMRISDWSSDVCSSDLLAVVHSGVHAGGAGRPTVRAARLHQDLGDGVGGDPVGDPGADPDGVADPRPHPGRAGQSGQPLADQPLPARDRLDDATAQDGAADRGAGLRDHGVAAHPARRSEEHTSELQSLMRISYAVLCLKKKNNKYSETSIHTTITIN